jgi:hypothetical protein
MCPLQESDQHRLSFALAIGPRTARNADKETREFAPRGCTQRSGLSLRALPQC